MRKSFKPIPLAATMLLLLLQSCSIDEERLSNQTNSDNSSDFPQLLMHTEQEYNSVDITEPVNEAKHGAFYSPQIAAAVAKANKAAGATTEYLTMQTENIPIWKYNGHDQSIFSDGTTEYTMKFKIIDDEEYNAILSIAGSVVDFDKIPSMANYSDGIMTLYGPKNNILFKAECPQPDLTEFKDTLEYYVNLCEELGESPETKSGTTDIAEVTQRLQKRGFDMSNATVSLENNCVIIQQTHNTNSPQFSSSQLTNNTPVFSRTVLSTDLSKVFKTYTFSGGQLLSLSTYKYMPDGDMYVNITGNETRIPLPSRIETMQLVLQNGIPMVHTTITSYTKNRITIYNNNL